MDKTLRILMIAAIALLFVSVNSCSLINYFSGYVKSWESKAPGRATLGDGMDRFVGSVRAPLGNPDAHYLLGDFYQGRGRHRDAIEEFNKAIRIDPRFVRAYNGIAVSLDQMGEHERAQEYYQAALQIQPDLDYLYNNMGYSFLLQERYEEAAGGLRKGQHALRGKDQPHPKQPGPGQQRPRERRPRRGARQPEAPGPHRVHGGKPAAEERRLRGGSRALQQGPRPGPRSARGAQGDGGGDPACRREALHGRGRDPLVVDGQDRLAVIGRDGVEISNGNGVRHMAKDVGAFLKKAGLQRRAPDQCRSLPVRQGKRLLQGRCGVHGPAGSRGPFPASRR